MRDKQRGAGQGNERRPWGKSSRGRSRVNPRPHACSTLGPAYPAYASNVGVTTREPTLHTFDLRLDATLNVYATINGALQVSNLKSSYSPPTRRSGLSCRSNIRLMLSALPFFPEIIQKAKYRPFPFSPRATKYNFHRHHLAG
jgi:hypothetical protein